MNEYEGTKPTREDVRQDGRQTARKTITSDKIQSLGTGTVNNAAIASGAVSISKLSYAAVSVSINSGAASGTATVATGDVIVGFYPSGNCDQIVKNVSISGTTLTVNLLTNATNATTIIVFVMHTP